MRMVEQRVEIDEIEEIADVMSLSRQEDTESTAYIFGRSGFQYECEDFIYGNGQESKVC